MKKKQPLLGHDIICEWTNLFRTFFLTLSILCDQAIIFGAHTCYFLCDQTTSFTFYAFGLVLFSQTSTQTIGPFLKKGTKSYVMVHGRNNYIFP